MRERNNAIEDYFGLDGLQLLAVFGTDKPAKGYTRTKALYSLAWVCLNRGGQICSLSDVLAEYAPDDFDLVESENLTNGGKEVSATESDSI